MCASPITRPDTAFIGFYGVDPPYQGLGVGRELWAKTLGRLEPSLNVGLHGVPEMVEKYKSAGFVVEDPASMLVYTSESGRADQLKLETLKDIDQLNDCQCSLEIIKGNLSEQLFNAIVSYDQRVQGYSRKGLLRNFLFGDRAPLTIVIVKNNNDGLEILGYGCIRRDNNSGGMVGPLYANSDDICEIILKNLLSRFRLTQDQIYSFMPLSSNAQAIKILQKLGVQEIERCSRLFTKFVPTAPYSNIYYMHSPNFSLF